jgi:Arc/MetJ-type ribon-helix-helix transcriptional regulator
LIYVAHLAGLRLRELPVRWNHNEGSKVEVMRDSLRMLSEVRAIRQQAARGLYQSAINAARAALRQQSEPMPTQDSDERQQQIQMGLAHPISETREL